VIRKLTVHQRIEILCLGRNGNLINFHRKIVAFTESVPVARKTFGDLNYDRSTGSRDELLIGENSPSLFVRDLVNEHPEKDNSYSQNRIFHQGIPQHKAIIPSKDKFCTKELIGILR